MMLTEVQKNMALRVISTSASDCEVSMVLQAGHSPMRTLDKVAVTLHYMNANGIEKISHRKALMKAGRKALNVLGDM